jgi:hypothetical protein
MAGTITALYVSTSASLDSTRNTQSPGTNNNRQSSQFALSSFFHAYDCDLLVNFPNICTSPRSKEFIGYLYVMP